MSVAGIGSRAPINQELFAQFREKIAGQGDGRISRNDIDQLMSQYVTNDGTISPVEQNTLLEAMRHFRFTNAASHFVGQSVSQIDSTNVLSLLTGGEGTRLSFDDLSTALEQGNRFADLYSAKSQMSGEDMMQMWDQGLSLPQFNQLLKQSLQPATTDELREMFGQTGMDGANEFDNVIKYLSETGQQELIDQINDNDMSPGQFQNLIYGSWEHNDPGLQGSTPFQADYTGEYVPLLPDELPASNSSQASTLFQATQTIDEALSEISAGQTHALDNFKFALDDIVVAGDSTGWTRSVRQSYTNNANKAIPVLQAAGFDHLVEELQQGLEQIQQESPAIAVG